MNWIIRLCNPGGDNRLWWLTAMSYQRSVPSVPSERSVPLRVGPSAKRCHLPCAARLLNRSSSPSGALPTAPNSCSPILPERTAWKKYFTYVDTFLLTWQVSRVSDDGAAFRTGGARLGQPSGTLPTIFSVADVAALRVEHRSNALAKLLQTGCRHRCGVRSTQEMILGSTEPQYACSAQLCCPRCR